MAERGVAPFTAFIGAEMEELREGYARLSLVIQERHTSPNGAMHGGVGVAAGLLPAATPTPPWR